MSTIKDALATVQGTLTTLISSIPSDKDLKEIEIICSLANKSLRLIEFKGAADIFKFVLTTIGLYKNSLKAEKTISHIASPSFGQVQRYALTGSGFKSLRNDAIAASLVLVGVVGIAHKLRLLPEQVSQKINSMMGYLTNAKQIQNIAKALILLPTIRNETNLKLKKIKMATAAVFLLKAISADSRVKAIPKLNDAMGVITSVAKWIQFSELANSE